MIVPASRRHVYDKSHLVVGQLYSIDSNLGGSFTVQYKGIERGFHHFVRPERPDWPKRDMLYTWEQVQAQVFINPPSDPYFCKLWDKQRRSKLTWSGIHKAHEAWFPELPGS